MHHAIRVLDTPEFRLWGHPFRRLAEMYKHTDIVWGWVLIVQVCTGNSGEDETMIICLLPYSVISERLFQNENL